MPAESLFAPIPREAIRRARARLALADLTVEGWARREGFKPKTVYNVLSGRRMAIRGVSLRIAIKLGLRPDPDHLDSPPGRTTVGEGPPAVPCGRRPVSQVGEPAR